MSKMGDRVNNVRESYRLAKQHDSRLGWILLTTFLVPLVAGIAAGVATRNPFTWIIIGLSVAIVLTAIIFSRRATRAAYRSIEDRPGASAAIVQNMSKQGWAVTPGVAINRNQDIVHRAVGRPGVVLIGEGSNPSLAALMANERKRTARFVPDIPITDVLVGREEGRVSVDKLDKHLRKLPKVLAPGEATSVRKKLDALAANPAPIPKGPMPKSARQARGGKLR